MKTKRLMRCPTCRTLVLSGGEDYPFCRGRCRRIDLGKWAAGDYRVSTPIENPDQLEELARAARSGDEESAA
jgi:endogenous inhibitor of DNA gyrase (YacG/DUF329 family)